MPTLYQRVIENPELARAHSEEQREKRNTEFDTAIGDLQKKYAAALKTDAKGNTIETPASLQAKYALTQALQARNAFQTPLSKPGVGQKIEEALRLKKKPQEQAVTTQTGGIKIPTESLKELPPKEDPRLAVPAGEPPNPVLKQRSEAAAPAAARQPEQQPQAETAVTIPGRSTTVKGPAFNAKQLREQAQRNQQAQEETELLTSSAPNAPENQYSAKRKELIAGGFNADDADKAVRIMAGLEAKPVATKPGSEDWLQVPGKINGKPTTILYDKKEGKYKAQNGDDLSDEDLAAFVPDPKQAKPSTAWKNEYAAAYARGHGITPEQLTPADMNFIDQQIALSSSAPSTTITNTLKQDANGFWVPIQESNRRIPGFGVILSDPRGRASGKSKVPTKDPEAAAAPTEAELPPATVGGAAPAAPLTVPTTPGAAKKLAAKRFKRPAAPATATATAPRAPKAPRTVGGGGRGFGGVRVGPELFAAPNKDYTAAKADLEGAIDRSNTMDRNLRAAMKGDQQAMISLVSNHIGMTLGGQKGARINQAVWNEAVESAHLDERMIAKSFHRDTNGDYIFDGWKTGVTLTPDQMHQMVGLAHEKVAVLQAHVGRLQRQLRLAPQATGGDKSLADRLDKALGGK
jgi:hypothetical protein